MKNYVAGAGGGSKGNKQSNDKNTLFSIASLQVLDLISEGQIGGLVDGAKSIYFDDVPLQNQTGSFNYDNVYVKEARGTPYQDMMQGYENTVIPIEVGAEVKNGFPVVRSITEIIADKVRCAVSIPYLYRVDNGLKKTSIEFKFEIAINNDDFVDYGTQRVEGKTSSQYQRSYTFNLPQRDSKGKAPERWLIRLTKLSPEADDDYVAALSFTTMFLISETKLNYPNSAIIGISATAENLSSIPTRSYIVDGLILQVPSNYDKKTNTYNGIWDGTFKMEVTDNPAWILYGLLTNTRWGLGEFIKPEQINKSKLYEIGRYCDELVDDGLGKKEKRFSINTQVTERSEAYELINSITSVFRGMTYWAMGQANFTCDKPTEPSVLFTQANVVNGEFRYAGSSRNEHHSVALITWNDPDQNYKQVVEYVEDRELIEKWGVRQSELTLFGCTSRAQAIRAGKWILYTEQYESDMISFTVGLDAALVLPGDIIKIHDPYHAGRRLGGRLKSCTTTSAVLDAVTQLKSEANPKISIRMPDNTFVTRTLKISDDEPRAEVFWDEPLPELPVDYAIWIIEEENLVPQIARVVNVAQGEDKGTFNIDCISYNKGKYDLIEKGWEIQLPNTSEIDPYDVGKPNNLNISVSISKSATGIRTGNLELSWTAGKNNASWVVEYRTEDKDGNGDEWTSVEVNSPYYTISNAQNGLYHIKIYAKGVLGTLSTELETYYDAEDSLPSPDDIQDFTITKRSTYLQLDWTPVEGALGYEIRIGDSWDAGEAIITNFAGNSFVHYQDKAGIYYYHIRAINSDGSLSKHVTTTRLDLHAPITPENFQVVRSNERLELKWDSNPETDITFYEIREGINWTASTLVCQSKLNHATIPVGAQTRRKFWIKAVCMPGIYSESADWYEIGVTNDKDKNIIIEMHERGLGFSNHRVYMSDRGDDLVMDDDRKRSEYIIPVDLFKKHYAHNSFSTSVTTIACTGEDTTTWEDLTCDFEAPGAERAWNLEGDQDGIVAYKQIALEYPLGSSDIEGISLENTTDTLSGKQAISAQAHYEPARYALGMTMNLITSAKWQLVDMPEHFKFSFWFKAKDQGRNKCAEILIMQTQDGAGWYKIYYNTEEKTLNLACSDGKDISFETEFLADDYFCIAFYQTNVTRGFGYGILGKQVEFKTTPAFPQGQIKLLSVGNA